MAEIPDGPFDVIVVDPHGRVVDLSTHGCVAPDARTPGGGLPTGPVLARTGAAIGMTVGIDSEWVRPAFTVGAPSPACLTGFGD